MCMTTKVLGHDRGGGTLTRARGEGVGGSGLTLWCNYIRNIRARVFLFVCGGVCVCKIWVWVENKVINRLYDAN